MYDSLGEEVGVLNKLSFSRENDQVLFCFLFIYISLPADEAFLVRWCRKAVCDYKAKFNGRCRENNIFDSFNSSPHVFG